eukprot:Em0022g659a
MVYQKIAVAVLACFCTDPEYPCEEDRVLIIDSLQCLQALGCSELGREHLFRCNSLEAIAQCFVLHQAGQLECRSLLLSLLSSKEVISAHIDMVMPVIEFLGHEFRSRQDKVKLELCSLLLSVITVGEEVLFTKESTWLKNVAVALSDILTNKTDAVYREDALCLAAILCRDYGLDWALEVEIQGKRPGTFFVLLVYLVGAEVQVQLYQSEFSAVLSRAKLISSCFLMLEAAVTRLASVCEDQQSGCAPSTMLTPGDQLQLHTSLTETFAAIVQFLDAVRQAHAPEDLCHPLHLVTMATVRVVGAWLAEESLAVPTELYTLLPFLLAMCQEATFTTPTSVTPTSTDVLRPASDTSLVCGEGLREEGGDMMKFLLPGLHHLTADATPRKVLLKANLSQVMCKYFLAVSVSPSSPEMKGRLISCCGIFLNLMVTEPDIVKNSAFVQVALTAASLLASEGPEDIFYMMHLCLVLLMVARRQGADTFSSKDLLPSWNIVFNTLVVALKSYPPLRPRNASKPNPAKEQWSDYSELWFLSIQELTAIIEQCGWLQEVGVASGAVEQLNGLLRKLPERDQEVMPSICSFLRVLTEL